MNKIEGVIVQLMGARQRAGFKKQETPRDTQLLERIAVRDAKAFEELYRQYQPRLARFLVNIVKRPQLVEEVLNDTMMAVWSTAGNFRGASKVSTWIFAIAYRQGVKARMRWDEPLPDLPDNDQQSSEAGPEEQLHNRRSHGALVAHERTRTGPRYQPNTSFLVSPEAARSTIRLNLRSRSTRLARRDTETGPEGPALLGSPWWAILDFEPVTSSIRN